MPWLPPGKLLVAGDPFTGHSSPWVSSGVVDATRCSLLRPNRQPRLPRPQVSHMKRSLAPDPRARVCLPPLCRFASTTSLFPFSMNLTHALLGWRRRQERLQGSLRSVSFALVVSFELNVPSITRRKANARDVGPSGTTAGCLTQLSLGEDCGGKCVAQSSPAPRG
jgi:hypothetical protein